jgi:hypothetical protein
MAEGSRELREGISLYRVTVCRGECLKFESNEIGCQGAATFRKKSIYISFS